MPVIVVYGIPTETTQQELKIFAKFMRQRTANVEELKIEKKQVSIFFPQDLMSEGLGEEIIIFVEDLFEKPERTEAVRKKLAMNLVDEVHQSFPDADLIECIIRPLNPRQGFYSGKKMEDGSFWGDSG